MTKKLRTDSIKFAGVFVIVVGIIIGLLLVKRSSDNRQRAATSTGTAQFLFTLPTNTTTIAPGSTVTMNVQAVGTAQSLVSGFQLVADISGTIPSNLAFTPATINGLAQIIPSLPGAPNDPTPALSTNASGGKTLSVVYFGANQIAYNANGAAVTFGTLTFTAPASGTMTITLNQSSSKIIQNSTNADLLALQGPVTYTFASNPPPPPPTTTVATPTPTPTVAPTAAPTPTPMPIAPGTTCTFTYGCTCTDSGRFMQNTWTCPAAVATPTPTPTVAPTVAPTATPVAGTTFTILAKFVGISTNVGQITAKVSDGGTVNSVVTFAHTTNGVYKATLTLPTGYILPSTYTFSVKPEKHVQQVFRLWPIANGTADLTSKLFQPGDLPPQDSIVNATDINTVITVISKASQTASDLATADVNYDGVVNSVDIGLILSTLSSKPDESL